MIPTNIKRHADTPTCHHQAMLKNGKTITEPVSNMYSHDKTVHAEIRSLFDWANERLRKE